MAYVDLFPRGAMSSYSWEEDPKRLAFTASRYKFVAKMVEGLDTVLEVGCADAYFSRIVAQHVGRLTCMDKDNKFIQAAKCQQSERWPIYFQTWDILNSTVLSQPGYDAVFSLDVMEHIDEEEKYLENLAFYAPLCIIGIPSLESQAFASEISKKGHVNCKTKSSLRHSMKRHWNTVLMFGMNDEVVHTGKDEMCNYLFGIGIR